MRLSASTSRYFVRKKISLDHRPNGTSEAMVLGEIASLRRYAHPHLLSVFASYLQHDSIFVLFTPAPAYSLRSFLSDVPKAFDRVPKSQRRKTILSWTHCLASALRWLHTNGRHHGAIRPSNIQITDEEFSVYLGQFDDPGVLGTHTKVDDLEAYQYAAPVSLLLQNCFWRILHHHVLFGSGSQAIVRGRALLLAEQITYVDFHSQI